MTNKLRIFLIVSCCALLAAIVYWQDSLHLASQQDSASACDLNEHSSCLFQTALGQSFKLTSYQTKFLLEQSNKLSLQIIKADRLNSFDLTVQAYLVGINMNMGRIPLSVVKQGEQYLIEVIPVMCAEQNMQWQVKLLIDTHQGNKNNPQTFFASFSTRW
ncbi:hypothetical protein ACMZOO_01680 [Catenovulum sp. SX2]|uniref:hypothetical protein n=1 Tax=Catenovulum sp. SX2 TaxID=3398614 RepID=UPI003F82A15D